MNINEIYRLRDSFSIIGLTGKTGSGCTKFSEIISKETNFCNNKMLRHPDEIPNDIPYDRTIQLIDNNIIFKKKYRICYDYIKVKERPYKTISYIHVLMFYAIHYSIFEEKVSKSEDLITSLYKLVNDNFSKSKIHDKDYSATSISKEQFTSICDNFDALFELFSKLPQNFKDITDESDYENLYNCYYNGVFETWVKEFYNLLGGVDYYLGSFFVHKIGNNIRETGVPSGINEESINTQSSNIYTVVYTINKLIKAWKWKNKDNCHICIDSFRNSLEIMFLKERYSAFYMIAIHNEGRHKERLTKRIEKAISKEKGDNAESRVKAIVKKVISLDETERKVNDFKKGDFYAPDVENCIQKSEIHINNPGKHFEIQKNLSRDTSFYTMTEQWIRIKSLMSHPGLVTPTHEERCMQIAYNSKFNSGCISRQVGAVITDENNSIRSVGWNDVPKGSVPCNIRNLSDIINPEKIDKTNDYSYSDFEISTEDISYKDGGNFSKNTKLTFSQHIKITEPLGLNYSFCFKSLHNNYEEKDNQVHTRSLHAEENAMLQISKYGGQPLKNGTLYTTASPCELCAKKAYQLGMKKIIYIDPYPGISMRHILENGYAKPNTKMFTGIIGKAYNKLFEPFLSYKDELTLLTDSIEVKANTIDKDSLECIEKLIGGKLPNDISKEIIQNKLNELVE